MNRYTRSIAAAFLLTVFLAPLSAAQSHYRNRLYIRDGQLVRGMTARPVTLRAVRTPGLFGAGVTDAAIATTLAAVSEAGANAVMFDLEGFSDTGKHIAPENLAAIDRVVAHVNYRYMVAVCRIFGDDAPQDAKYRRAAIKTAAETFKNSYSLIYWVDGTDSESLVAAFTLGAPKLAVAAPRGGMIDVVESLDAVSPARPALLVDAVPQPPDSPVHCVLFDFESALRTYESALAHPIEKQPWTPSTEGLSQAEIDEGWIRLFDGKTLDGWILTGPNQNGFVVEDGAIEWAARGGGVVRTRDRYDNFILRLEYRIREKGNSGIFVRAPRANRASKIGMEFQIMGDPGKTPDLQTTGAIYSVVAPRINAGKKAWEWNEVELLLDGPHFRATLNGQVVQDVNLDEHEELKYRLRRGFIGLQDHGHPGSFRNIRLKKLPG